jgi:GNAT superfamily N-acetyltransferase
MSISMQLRVARHTGRLDEVVRFYRDGIGLPQIGGFRDHAGYDGVFLAVPGTGTHLELTSGGRHAAPQPHPESLLVLYLGDREVVRSVARRLSAEPVAPPNPYWAQTGLTFLDPDGFRVVLVAARWQVARGDVRVAWHAGPRSELRGLFELAEDSRERLEASIDQGRVLVATGGELVVGYLQLVETDTPGEVELKSMAVAEHSQQQGVGRALVGRATAECPRRGRAHDARGNGGRGHWQPALLPAARVPHAADRTRRLRLGRRYPDALTVDGIPLRDRVWLTLALSGDSRGVTGGRPPGLSCDPAHEEKPHARRVRADQ